MASLFSVTKKAETYAGLGNRLAAKREIKMAESIIAQHWPPAGTQPPAICCFVADGEIIYCTEDKLHINVRTKKITVVDRVPLFPARAEERKKLCAQCREDCRKRIAKLKKEFARQIRDARNRRVRAAQESARRINRNTKTSNQKGGK